MQLTAEEKHNIRSIVLPLVDDLYRVAMQLTRRADGAEDLVADTVAWACVHFRVAGVGYPFKASVIRKAVCNSPWTRKILCSRLPMRRMSKHSGWFPSIAVALIASGLSRLDGHDGETTITTYRFSSARTTLWPTQPRGTTPGIASSTILFQTYAQSLSGRTTHELGENQLSWRRC